MSFNLVTQAWFPVVYHDGHTAELGLRDVFAQADAIRDLGGETPPVTGALYRLLLAIMYRSVPLIGEAWFRAFESGWGDLPQQYLERWQGRFDIFDPDYPFFQCPTVSRNAQPATIIVLEWASGSNATLFDKHCDAEGVTLQASEAARRLLTVQTYGLSGLGGGGSFPDAPWARGVVFLAQGRNLRETLLLNWLPPELRGFEGDTSSDAPFWEREEPWASDALGDLHEREALGWLDYLTWPARRLLLLPEYEEGGPVVRQIRWSLGYRAPRLYLDPHKHWIKASKPKPDGSTWSYLQLDEGRVLWRNLSAILALLPPQEETPEVTEEDTASSAKKRQARPRKPAPPPLPQRPPLVLEWLRALQARELLPATAVTGVLALAIIPHEQRALARGYRREQFELPVAYLHDAALRETLATALAQAESLGRSIWGATRTWATLSLAPLSDVDPNVKAPAPEDLKKMAATLDLESRYWGSLSSAFTRLLHELPEDPENALRAWRKALAAAVTDLFPLLGDTLKASTLAQLQLGAALSRTPKLKNPLVSRSTDMENPERFIQYLEHLRDKQDRAALAALRAGADREPGTVASMYPYVAPWTFTNTPWRDAGLYAVAALFALHPTAGGRGDFGSTLRRARKDQQPDAGIERRFQQLLEADVEQLPRLLFQLVTLLKSRGVPVNWHQLLRDYWGWNHPSGYVQRRWAASYWRAYSADDAENDTEGSGAAASTPPAA